MMEVTISRQGVVTRRGKVIGSVARESGQWVATRNGACVSTSAVRGDAVEALAEQYAADIRGDLPPDFEALGEWWNQEKLVPSACRNINRGTWVYFIVSWETRSAYIGTSTRLGARMAEHRSGGTGVSYCAAQVGLRLSDLEVYILQLREPIAGWRVPPRLGIWAERWASQFATEAGFVVWSRDGHSPSWPDPRALRITKS